MMKKKLIGMMVVLISALWIGIRVNLSYNAVYYAAHMPKGKYRVAEAMMVVDHLGLLSDDELSGFMPEIDGYAWVTKETDAGYETFEEHKSPDSNISSYYNFQVINHEDTTVYYIANNGEIKTAWNYDTGNVEIKIARNGNKGNVEVLKVEEQKQAYQKIQSFIQPIVNKQPKPNVNLQWLFNVINYRRFND